MSKFNRDNYLKTVTVNSVLEKELTTNSFSDYKFKYPCAYFTITSRHIQRPDLISNDMYDRTDFWWFVLKFNNIDDAWNEIYISQRIKVPDTRDIIDYINEYK